MKGRSDAAKTLNQFSIAYLLWGMMKDGTPIKLTKADEKYIKGNIKNGKHIGLSSFYNTNEKIIEQTIFIR